MTSQQQQPRPQAPSSSPKSPTRSAPHQADGDERELGSRDDENDGIARRNGQSETDSADPGARVGETHQAPSDGAYDDEAELF